VLLATLVRRRGSWLDRPRELFCRTFLILACGTALLSLTPAGMVMATAGYSWLAFFYANLLILVVIKPGRVGSLIFGNRVLVWLGTVSYGVYMFHEGIRGLVFAILQHRAAQIDDWSSLGVTILALLATLSLAQLSWMVYERPLVEYSHARYRYQRNRVLAASASTVPAPKAVSIG